MAKLVIVDGNICAGKSTLAEALAAATGFLPFYEPTKSNPYLSKFYGSPKEYALPMQMWLLRQRFRTYINAVAHVLRTGQGVLLDRSIFSDWVFAEKNRRDGNISEEGYRYYMTVRNKMLSELPWPTCVVYLDVQPSVCYDRVHMLRQRGCESVIPLEYLAGLDECYRLMLRAMQERGTTIVSCDWNKFGATEGVASLIAAQEPLSMSMEQRDLLELMTDESFDMRERMTVDRNAWPGIRDDETDLDAAICDESVSDANSSPRGGMDESGSGPSSPDKM